MKELMSNLEVLNDAVDLAKQLVHLLQVITLLLLVRLGIEVCKLFKDV